MKKFGQIKVLAPLLLLTVVGWCMFLLTGCINVLGTRINEVEAYRKEAASNRNENIIAKIQKLESEVKAFTKKTLVDGNYLNGYIGEVDSEQVIVTGGSLSINGSGNENNVAKYTTNEDNLDFSLKVELYKNNEKESLDFSSVKRIPQEFNGAKFDSEKEYINKESYNYYITSLVEADNICASSIIRQSKYDGIEYPQYIILHNCKFIYTKNKFILKANYDVLFPFNSNETSNHTVSPEGGQMEFIFPRKD